MGNDSAEGGWPGSTGSDLGLLSTPRRGPTRSGPGTSREMHSEQSSWISSSRSMMSSNKRADSPSRFRHRRSDASNFISSQQPEQRTAKRGHATAKLAASGCGMGGHQVDEKFEAVEEVRRPLPSASQWSLKSPAGGRSLHPQPQCRTAEAEAFMSITTRIAEPHTPSMRLRRQRVQNRSQCLLLRHRPRPPHSILSGNPTCLRSANTLEEWQRLLVAMALSTRTSKATTWNGQ